MVQKRHTMNRIAARQTFFVLCFSGPMLTPTVTRVGRGFWGPDGEAKALKKAAKLAESNIANRYYVAKTIKGFRKALPPPVNESKSYTG